MAQRDEIHRSLRADLRQIRLDQFNLELRRLAVDVAITQTDVARLKLIEPEKPVSDGKTAAISPTVARDLVDALTYLQSTQFDLITVWGDYEVRRRQLDYDLGTMELDERGMWTDPGPLTDEMLLTRYYEFCADPLNTPQELQSSGYVELGPGDLPPEPSKLDFPAL